MAKGKKIDRWRWIASADACPACASLEGEYDECPGAPHPNCHCTCIHMEAQVNPPGPKAPYKVGFQMASEGKPGEDFSRWKVAVTCLHRAGDDEEEDEGGSEGWEDGESHMGEIDLPSEPMGLTLGSPEQIAWDEKHEEMLQQYGRDLYENYCIGFA